MAKSKKRKKKRNRYRRVIQMLVVTILVVLIALGMILQMHRMHSVEEGLIAQEESLQVRLQDEEDRAQELKDAQSGELSKEQIEQEAREKLGLVKPDEVVVKAK